jgi:hypothetical protein
VWPVIAGAAVNDTSDLLGSLNSNPSFDLSSTLNTFYGEGNDDINSIDLLDSKYYDINSFLNSFRNTWIIISELEYM